MVGCLNMEMAIQMIEQPPAYYEGSEGIHQSHTDQSGMKPSFVVNPKNAHEVEKIVMWANQTRTPLIPVSSGPPRFHGDTVPSTAEAVIVNVSGMKEIIRIDRRNRIVLIEPEVTFSQLQPIQR